VPPHLNLGGGIPGILSIQKLQPCLEGVAPTWLSYQKVQGVNPSPTPAINADGMPFSKRSMLILGPPRSGGVMAGSTQPLTQEVFPGNMSSTRTNAGIQLKVAGGPVLMVLLALLSSGWHCPILTMR
jgi:hypothetical protein